MTLKLVFDIIQKDIYNYSKIFLFKKLRRISKKWKKIIILKLKAVLKFYFSTQSE